MTLSKLGGARAWLIWIIANLLVILGFNMQTGYAIVNGLISTELALGVAQMASIAAIYTWIFAVSQLFSGSILDLLGIRKVFPVAILLITAGAYLFSTASSFEALLVSQIFLAIGASFGFVGAGLTGGLWFGFSKFGIMFGLTQFVASIGSQAGQMLYTNLLDNGVMWRSLINGMVIFGLVLFVLSIIFVRDPVLSTTAKPKISLGAFFAGVFSSITNILKIKDIWLTSLQGGITFGSFLGIGVFWGAKILAVKGFDFTTAAYMSALIWLGLAIFSPVCNMMSDSIKSRKIVLGLFAVVQVLSMLAVMYGPVNLIFMGIAMFIFGAAAGGHMLNFTMGGEIVEPKYVGTSAAIVNGFMFIIGGVVISLPSKFLIDGAELTEASLNSALLVYPVLLVVASLITFFMKESYKK